MDATEVFSKITYLEQSMKLLLAQKAVSSEEIQQLLAAVEAKTQPIVRFNTEGVANLLAPKLAAKLPGLDTAAVARQLGPLLVAGLPTPDNLRQAGNEVAAKMNKEFTHQEKRTIDFVGYMRGELTAVQEQVKEIVDRLPASMRLDISWDKRMLALVLGTPVICLLALLIYSAAFRVSKADYERLEAQRVLLQRRTFALRRESDIMTDANIFYSNQIKAYQRKFPKSAGYFRPYRPAQTIPPVPPAAQ